MNTILQIGPCRIELNIEGNEEVAKYWSSYVKSHSAIATTNPYLVLNIKVNLVPGWLNPLGDRGVCREKEGDGSWRIVVEKRALSGNATETDKGLNGSFTVNGDGSASLDGVASLCTALMCSKFKGMMLHSSAVSRDGRIMLFLGKGGAGKTTLATELLDRGCTFSVDRTLVTLDETGVPIAHSTPLGDIDEQIMRPGAGRISSIFFIEQASKPELVSLSDFESAQKLLKNTIVPIINPETVDQMLDMSLRTLEFAPAYRLRFPRNTSFWSVIDGELSKVESDLLKGALNYVCSR